MARKSQSQITVTSRADRAITRNAALARRLETGAVFGAGSRQIPLKEPARWQLYVMNTYVNDNAFYEMREGGWVPLVPEDLACPVEESGFRVSPDGSLVRGPEGKEMVFKMATEDYALLQAAKTARNLKGIGSRSQAKSDMANAAGAALGAEAGDYIDRLDGHVIDTLTGGAE